MNTSTPLFSSIISRALLPAFLLLFTLCLTVTNSYSMNTWETIKTALFEPAYNPAQGNRVCQGYRELWEELSCKTLHEELNDEQQQLLDTMEEGVTICDERNALLQYQSRQKSPSTSLDKIISPLQTWRYIKGKVYMKKSDEPLVQAYARDSNAYKGLAMMDRVLREHTPQPDTRVQRQNAGASLAQPEELVAPTRQEIFDSLNAGYDACQGFSTLHQKMLTLLVSASQHEKQQKIYNTINLGMEQCIKRKKAVASYKVHLDKPIASNQWVRDMQTGVLIAHKDAEVVKLYEDTNDLVESLERPSQSLAIAEAALRRKLAYDPSPGNRMCNGFVHMHAEMAVLSTQSPSASPSLILQRSLNDGVEACTLRQEQIDSYQKTGSIGQRLRLKDIDQSLATAYQLSLIDFVSTKARSQKK